MKKLCLLLILPICISMFLSCSKETVELSESHIIWNNETYTLDGAFECRLNDFEHCGEHHISRGRYINNSGETAFLYIDFTANLKELPVATQTISPTTFNSTKETIIDNRLRFDVFGCFISKFEIRSGNKSMSIGGGTIEAISEDLGVAIILKNIVLESNTGARSTISSGRIVCR